MATQFPLSTPSGATAAAAAALEAQYEHAETRDLVVLVNDAAELVRSQGEAAFNELRVPGSRWRQGETYVFVLDPEGKMLVHPDPALEGKNQLELKDVNGKPIVRGLIAAATMLPSKSDGWFHYEWPVPGGLLPRWKSSYVRRVSAPSGKRFIVGGGMYNDRMERAFVVDAVANAVGEIEHKGEAALDLLRDPTGPFLVKDAYIFVIDLSGVELFNPAFPNLEGRNVLDLRDTQGKYLHREMIRLVQTQPEGWVDYMWPKPGETVSTKKSAYVRRTWLGTRAVLVGSGVYLADAPKETRPRPTMTASELMILVRDAAAVLQEKGESAYPELRTKGSKWLRDDTYFFVWTIEGTRVFFAPDPKMEGLDVSALEDVHGRPIGRMILDAATSVSGEGWVHYMYPEPEDIFPTWKSTFVKRVTFPSGKRHIVGCGIYNMQMDNVFIEDVVNRAAALIEKQGTEAFAQLRDRKGPFVFMDTYVFVDGIDGTELVNPAQPSLEGENLLGFEDLAGKSVVRDEIDLATKQGSAWLECQWYKPGDNRPARKLTYVRSVRFGDDTYVVGSGIYVP